MMPLSLGQAALKGLRAIRGYGEGLLTEDAVKALDNGWQFAEGFQSKYWH
jgi:hypothetical protein